MFDEVDNDNKHTLFMRHVLREWTTNMGKEERTMKYKKKKTTRSITTTTIVVIPGVVEETIWRSFALLFLISLNEKVSIHALAMTKFNFVAVYFT